MMALFNANRYDDALAQAMTCRKMTTKSPRGPIPREHDGTHPQPSAGQEQPASGATEGGTRMKAHEFGRGE